jgi:tRNA (uracil-5-)-methyltransferase TRM9
MPPEPLVDSYGSYYRSGLYDARYPAPLPGTYARVLGLARGARRVLDFGAGSGRYTLPLLHDTDAFVCAHDITPEACATVAARAEAAGMDPARYLATTDREQVIAAAPFDLVIALFGVLSHVAGGTAGRVATLHWLRGLLAPGGALLVTVPNARRRFPLHPAQEPAPLTRRYAPHARAIVYRHQLADGERAFAYHLFSPRQLVGELRAAGLRVEALEADSMLPERDLARHAGLARTDRLLIRVLPTAVAYGLRAVARPASSRQ